VFSNLYGELISPAAISQGFGRHCRAIGIDASIHALRHTYAAQLIAGGIPLKVISDRLGHSSIRITAEVYGHLIRGVDEQAADLINERFM
jgi:integrase